MKMEANEIVCNFFGLLWIISKLRASRRKYRTSQGTFVSKTFEEIFKQNARLVATEIQKGSEYTILHNGAKSITTYTTSNCVQYLLATLWQSSHL